MKICVVGYAGSGKSTLAFNLGALYGIPVFYLDCYHFEPGWVERDMPSMDADIRRDTAGLDSWVIEGNYLKIYPERFREADLIIFLNYNRFACLKGVFHRRLKYARRSRPSMTRGCKERIDFEFFWWVLWRGRDKEHRASFRSLRSLSPSFLTCKNRRALMRYLRTLGITNKDLKLE